MHILHGKVIAIYKVLGDAVRIYTVAAHWVVEHENLDGLARQVDKQERANSWIDVDLPPRETLPPQVQQDIADTFDLLNGDGKGANALRQFAQGNSQALIPYISMLKELGNDSLTQVPLTQLQKMAADWLKSGQ